MRKFISVLLVLMLVLSTTTVAFLAESHHLTDEGVRSTVDYADEMGLGEDDLAKVYFLLPDGVHGDLGSDGNPAPSWYDELMTIDGQGYAGMYWFGSDAAYPCDEWTGFKCEVDDADESVFFAYIPVGVPSIIFNNGVNGGNDKTADVYTRAHQTVDMNAQGAGPEEYEHLPEGTPVYDEDEEEGTFDGCIFVIDPDATSVNPFSKKETNDGNWYIYYGNGCYGEYAEDSENFVSIEENCLNPAHHHRADEPTETPQPTDEPTPEPTTAPQIGQFYVVGNFTNWGVDEDYKMTLNEAAETEEYTFNIDLTTESQFKVVYVDPETGDQTWIPDGMGNNYGENGEITEDGNYDIYFRPNADGGDDWFYNCIYVAAAEPEEPTDAPEPTLAPQEGNFYVVGNFTSWSVDEAYKMTLNEAAETEEYMFNMDLTTESQFKVVYVDPETGDQTWIPDGMGNNYGENGEITEDGNYDIFFRPNADGGDDWFYNCIYVAAAEPEEPTDAPEPTDEPTPEPKAYVVGNMTNWAVDEAYEMAPNNEAETDEFFLNLDLAEDAQFKCVIVMEGEQFWFPEGMGNNYGENGELPGAGNYNIYFRPNYDGGDDWFYNCIYVEGTEPEPTDEPTPEPTDEPAPEPKAYVVGNMTNWAVDEAYEMAPNNEAETDEFFLNLDLAEDAQFKCVIVMEGEQFWFPEGMGNNYGENGELPGAGNYNIYFRPNYDGGDDWFYNCIYVEGTEPEPTDEPTPEPTDEPAPEPKAYVVGNFTNWAVDEAYEMAPNDGVETDEFFLNLDLAEDAQFKCVIVMEGEQFWFPEGMGNNYGENGELPGAGNYNIYFRPNYDGGDDWFYNCIYVEGTEPEPTDEPTPEPTDEPAPEPKAYVVGNMTNWAVDEAYEMAPNNEAETDEYYLNLDLDADAQFKCVIVMEGEQFWFPEGMGNNYGENGELPGAGNYNIYFRPNYDGGDDWFYNCIYVASTEPEPTDEPTPEPTDEPAPEPKAYVVGSFTNWAVDEAYEMAPNNEAETDEFFLNLDLDADAQFKCVIVMEGEQFWFPEGMGNNYGENGELPGAGNYNIYFRPNYDGGDDWFYNCIYVEGTEPEPTDEPTPEPTDEPAPEPKAYVVGNFTNWAVDEAYQMAPNDQIEDYEFCLNLDLDADAQFKCVIVMEGEQFWFPEGMGNNYGENGELPGAGNYNIYFRPNYDGGDDWFYNCIYVESTTPEPTDEPTPEPTDEPAPEPKAYVVGNFTNWAVDDAYEMAKNEEAETDEFMLNLDLDADAQFKCVIVMEGEQFWFPEGMGNNYGENGELPGAGNYNIYFRPNYDGGDDWFYNCIYVEECSGYVLGDVDGDGEVTSADATFIQRFDAEMPLPEEVASNIMNGDVDGNGEVDIVDVTFIQRYLADYPNLKYPIGTKVHAKG